tara:strand:- start:1305 stop:3836 length:2532 start_codon:yes stop_codon:yes gene_type:complete
MTLNANEAAIRAALGMLVPNQVVELRALHVPVSPSVSRTFSGFFSSLDLLAKAAAALSDQGASGVYFTMNPVDPDFLDRSPNEVGPARRGMLTKDENVTRVKWLLIDIDPIRAEGQTKQCATDEEKAEAAQVARKVTRFLTGQGWTSPYFGDSGNGYHLMYPLESAESEQLKTVLDMLAFMFNTDGALVDQAVFNPSRIWKLYGTVARKGTSSEERPWRRAKLFPAEGVLPEITQQQIRELIARAPRNPGGRNRGADAEARLDVYLQNHFPQLGEAEAWRGQGRRWVFDVCPFDDRHVDRSAYIIQFNNGAIASGCLHQNCEGAQRDNEEKSLGWQNLQQVAGEVFEGGTTRTAPPLPTAASTLDAPNLTDLGNAKRLVRSFQHEVFYCPTHGSWYIYDDTRWNRDLDGAVYRRAKTAVGLIFAEAEAETDPTAQEEIQRHARRSESYTALRAMVGLAASESELVQTTEKLDADPWMFNAANGTIDLRTGKLQDHDRTDLITKISEVPYQPDAKCPLWDEFLLFAAEEDPEVVSFIHRFFGYCMTGMVTEQVMLFMEGTGCNGKTTALLMLMHVMGEYAIQGAPGLLIAKRHESHPTEVADLMGARFVANSEVNKGGHFAEALIKQLTGSDPIRARRMRQDFFQFVPTHKLCIVANHRPIIKGNDEGIWRRVLRLPWNRRITEDRKDPDFLSKIKAEAPGILSRLVQGCLEWQRDGLQPPKKVQMATQEYREEMDVLSEFMEDRCIIGRGLKIAKKELYRAYSYWCEDINQKPPSYSLFNRQLQERDFKSFVTSVKNGGTRQSLRMWRGLTLKAVAEQEGTLPESPMAGLEKAFGWDTPDAEA